MDKSAGQNRAASTLYSPIHPFDRKMIDVGDGHLIYVEQCGNPKGIPILVLHGGPGGGCNPYMRRFFDPNSYHIILFDQRGCGKSKPFASVFNNTTWDLISDIEKIRSYLNIENLNSYESMDVHFAICACHPCAGAMLILSVSFQFIGG